MLHTHALVPAAPLVRSASPAAHVVGSVSRAVALLSVVAAAPLGWVSSLFTTWRAQRRLRAYGPGVVLALRDFHRPH